MTRHRRDAIGASAADRRLAIMSARHVPDGIYGRRFGKQNQGRLEHGSCHDSESRLRSLSLTVNADTPLGYYILGRARLLWIYLQT
ncbi:hypothetical protein Zmor_008254 [Zophobas morio]|uniref:Uncharacterized protein n=1 Tax=Zophobas morio TaxID=2755281 RepID=A0AA38J3V2_9CUCU|nr:hypothetical protein Zmor_008254 [Zophobas morio]